MSMPSPNLNESEPSCSPHQTANVENGPLYAIVYDPLEHEIFFEKLQDLNSKCTDITDKSVTNR